MDKFTRNFGRAVARDFVPKSSEVLISITDPETQDAELQPGWYAILRLKFWDVDADKGGYKPATDEQIKQIYNFIREHWGHNIYVHCEAGVSRSGAVRQFLEDNGWTVTGPFNWILPNNLILRKLNEIRRDDLFHE